MITFNKLERPLASASSSEEMSTNIKDNQGYYVLEVKEYQGLGLDGGRMMRLMERLDDLIQLVNDTLLNNEPNTVTDLAREISDYVMKGDKAT
jgi:hypothetical protein